MSVYHAGNALPPAKVLRLAAGKRALNLCLGMAAVAFRLAFRRKPIAPQNIVILEPFGMGDLIALEPLVSVLAGSGHKVFLAGKRPWAAIAPPLPNVVWVDIDLPWAAYSASAKYLDKDFPSKLVPGLKKLQSIARGAIGIDPRGDMRSILLLWSAGCSRVLSPSHYIHSSTRNLPLASEQWTPNPGFHKFRSNLEALRLLQIPLPSPRAPRLAHLRPDRIRGNLRVSLVPAAPWKGKHWPPERWADLAARLTAKGQHPQVLCGPGQAEAARRLVTTPLSVVECRDISSWAENLVQSSAIVSVDSGPMHLAAALDVPVVALFGGGLLPCWGPASAKSAIVTHQFDEGFGPCHQTENHLAFEQRMMAKISVDEVLEALQHVAPVDSVSREIHFPIP